MEWIKPAGADVRCDTSTPYYTGSFLVANGLEEGVTDTNLAACYTGYPGSGTWKWLPLAPDRRSQASGVSATIDWTNVALIFGGKGPLCTGPGLTCDKVEMFTPSVPTGTLQWSYLATTNPMPDPAAALGAVEAQVAQPDGSVVEKVYVLGGRQCDTLYGCAPLDTLRILDTATKTWSVGPVMPTARSDIQSVATGYVGSCLWVYAFGGNAGYLGGDLATVDAYDTCTDTWMPPGTVASMPVFVRGAVAGGYPGSSICVVGGYNGSWPTNLIQTYDPYSNTWTAFSTPIARPDLAPTDPYLQYLVAKGFDPEVDTHYCY